jgi:phospholipid/cholesterol/gamma-HCH transport system substrate-binding protein
LEAFNKMREKTIEITVGLFVLAGLLAFLVLALRVSGLTDVYSAKDGYEITAEFENVGGLKPKARVSIAGVPVGRVKAVVFDKNTHYAKVTMLIFNSVDNLPENTEAQILTAGLLGDNYIGLLPLQSVDEPTQAPSYLKAGANIGVESTHKAVILEELISKFLANQTIKS